MQGGLLFHHGVSEFCESKAAGWVFIHFDHAHIFGSGWDKQINFIATVQILIHYNLQLRRYI